MVFSIAPLDSVSTHGSTNQSIQLDEGLARSHASETAAKLLAGKFYRVLDVEREKKGNVFRNEALISCSDATIRVYWEDTLFHSKVYSGQIVSPRFGSQIVCNSGCTKISRLVVLECPDARVNLFDLVPHNWVKNRELVARAVNLYEELPQPHRLLFNAIFWNASRFERFCRQPSSMIGHHAEINGNFRHSVEVAEEMRKYCLTRSYTNMHLGILAALLHDAGKADEYVMNAKGGWELTDRGRLLGHKVTVVEWIAASVAKWNIQLPPDHYESLLHIFTAIPNAPEWMGLREPALHESFLLSVCDRLSGRDDLMKRTLPEQGGFGQPHKHLKCAHFKVRG